MQERAKVRLLQIQDIILSDILSWYYIYPMLSILPKVKKFKTGNEF